MFESRKRRLRLNVSLIFAVAVFVIAGFGVSESVSSNRVSGQTGIDTANILASSATTPRLKGTSRVKRPASLSNELIFGRGGFGNFSLSTLTDIGGQNNENGITSSNEHDPVFSPNGALVLFRSYRDGESGSGINEVYSMLADGYDQTRLTANDCRDSQYAISPDSATIAFVCSGNLWTMNANGSAQMLIADFANDISEPQFAPDGTYIIFIYDGTVWRVDPDGLNSAELGNQGGKERARFSPNGSKIIFAANGDIYSMNSDGTGEVKLVDSGIVGYTLDIPEYSPDGTKFLMECRGAGVNICVADADGTNFVPIPGTILERQYPVWSPDSSSVAFIARDATVNKYGIYLSTGGQTPTPLYIADDGSILRYLAWQPSCPTAPTPTPTPSGTPIPGLISEWNANDGTANDSRGINNGSFMDGAALQAPGKAGAYAFHFAGDGGYINIPDSNSLDVQTGDYTLSTWFFPEGPAENYIAGKGACGNNFSNFYIGVDTNYVPFIDISHDSGGSRIGNGGFVLTQATWHHLLLKKEANNFTLWVDDQLAVSWDDAGPFNVGTQPFTIGKGDACTSPQLTTNGAVDEVLLFDRALNAEEITAIYDGYTPPPGPTPTPTPTGSLVGFWQANGDATDSAGGHDGTLEGDTTFGTGHSGQAFDFDGSGDRVRVPDGGNDDLDVQTGDMTIAAWVYIRSNGDHFIAGKEFGDNSYSLKVRGQALYFELINGGNVDYINTGPDLTYNEWHHVAGVKANGQIKVFVDGGEKSSTEFTTSLVANGTDFTIGGPVYTTSPQPDTNGLIDDVRLYSRGLDATELTAIFNDPGFAATHNTVRKKVTSRMNTLCQTPPDPGVELRVNYPNPVAAGRQTNINIRLKDLAPVGGTVVDLTYPNADVASGPSSVTVPENSREVNVDVTTTLGSTFRSGDVIATLGSDNARVTVTVGPAAPDVAASNLTAPPMVSVNQNFTASWTVTNNGQAPTNSYRQDTFYISTDNVLFNDPNDRVVGRSYDNNGVIAPGGSENMTFNAVNIPPQYIPTDGTYYLFILVGDAGTVQERGGNFGDNYICIPILVNRNLPDLVAENVVGPAEIEPGVTYTLSWDVANRGSAATVTGSRDDIYFSYDQTIGNADDVLLTQRFNGVFAVGQVVSSSQQFSLPTVPARSSSDGLFYVKVDAGNQVYEDEPGAPAETNNTTSAAVRYEYRVPDLQVASVTPPVEVESDTAFDLDWSTKNFGNKTAGPINERVYFSTDAVVSGNDTLIGTFPLAQSLDPGQSVDRIQSVSIPTNAVPATGNYYVYVITDADGAINEGVNENNNVTFAPLRVRRLLRPDLQITNITAPSAAFFDQTIQVQWTVTNAGSGPTNAANWQDTLYIGLNQTLNGAIPLATLSNVSFLNAGEAYIASATVKIPRGFSGSYYLIPKTDVDNTVNEENENNNLATKPITINIPPLPDLTASNVQAPDQGFGGQPIAVSWTVSNSGTGDTPSGESTWTDAVYLSRDNVFSSDDRLIGSRQRSGVLTSGGNYSVSNFNVTLPSDTYGDYYVFVVADSNNNLFEFNAENNNSDYDRIAPGSPMHVLGTPPDLTVLSPITAPTSGLAGNPINVQFVVKNQGAFDAAGTWYDTLYLSTDANFDPLIDTPIANVVHNSLAAGQQYVNNVNTTLPNCLNGTYYLFAVTDAYGQIFEFDPNINAEANNVSSAKQIDITNYSPDLQVTDVTVPPVVINGSMPMSWTVKNFGTAATTQTAWTDRVFLYNGQQLINLGYFDHLGALPIGGQYTQNQVIHVPLFLEGDFQIIVRTDAFNSVPECTLDENNDDSAPTQVGQDLPDLRITGVSSPGSAELGSTFNVSWNGGNFASAMSQPTAWADTVYLSTDPTLNPGDTPIGGTVLNAALAANQTYNGNVNVTIPNVPPGSYYLIVNADNGNNISEGINESNNASTAVPITLTAPQVDLQATSVTADPVLFSGQFADVSWTVNNFGANPTLSSSWTDYVILSRDLVIDPSDRILGFKQHNGSLSGGGAYNETLSLQIPAGLTGEYKIFVVTDRNNNVVESNETNNTSQPATVELQLPPPVELNITNITPPATATPGDDATFTWTVQNSSANAVNGAWQDSVYLSTDQTWDSGDVLIGQQPHSGTVGAFATYTETLTIPMPPVELGNYYVIVRTDSRNTVRESDETNNVTSSGTQTSVTLPTLTLGTALNTSLITSQERYYNILNVPQGETMLVSLTGEPGSQNELYTKSGSVVSRANYDIQGTKQGFPDQENVVPNTEASPYYTMARGDYVPGSFSASLKKADTAKAKAAAAAQAVILKAELLPFGIRTVSPVEAGNNGYSFLSIDGAKFVDGATVKMVGPGGNELTPIKIIFSGTTNVKALFDLKNVAAGDYQVTLTNPNSQASTWASNFHVRNGGGEQISTQVEGAGEVRTGRFYRYTITTRNDGSNDAIGVPILVILSSPLNYRLSTSNQFQVQTAGFDPSTVPTHIDVDGKRVIPLFAPVVRGGESVNIGIDVEFGGGATITAVAMPPLFTPNAVLVPPLRAADGSGGGTDGLDVVNCFADLLLKGLLIALSEVIPADCAYSVANAMLGLSETAFSNFRGGFDVYSTATSLLQSAISIATDCAKNLVRYIPWIKFASLLYDVYQLLQIALECSKKTVEYVFRVDLSRSIDPNEKLGPVGFGPERWVPKDTPLLYRINFENKSDATAPAQSIRVIDQIPATLDPRTVRLIEMGFKQYRVEVPANRAFYQTRLQLGADLNNLKADISAGLDVATGRVTWNFTAIDPVTNERPLSPLDGILPPNNSQNDGEGYVVFSVQPASGQLTRTDLANTATIYFDENEPIVTNTTTNLLDADIPVSQVAPLSATSDTPDFPISWTGSDDPNGSGLAGFDLMVSENGGTYLPFVTNASGSGVVFNGKWGRTYRFYSVATDNAGNVEPAPSVPDATITVLGGAYEADVASRPNGDNDGSVNDQDVDQIRRFAAKLDTDLQYNEFQRADTAPAVDGGDGTLSVADVMQARRYSAGLDPVKGNSGPLAATGFSGKTKTGKLPPSLLPRELFPVFVSRTANKVVLGVRMDANGDETGIGFTLNFNPADIANPGNIVMGTDSAGSSLTANTSQPGKIGIIIDRAPGSPWVAGSNELVRIEFDVVNNSATETPIAFTSDLVKAETVDGTASGLTTSFNSGNVILYAPTAAGVSVSGRVVDRSGRPIPNTAITITGEGGFLKQAITNAFGYYQLDDVEVGRTYVVSARHKFKQFDRPSIVLSLVDAVGDVNFVSRE